MDFAAALNGFVDDLFLGRHVADLTELNRELGHAAADRRAEIAAAEQRLSDLAGREREAVAMAAELRRQIAVLERDRESAAAGAATARATLSAATVERDQVGSTLAALQQQHGDLTAAIAALQQQHSDLTAAIAALQQQHTATIDTAANTHAARIAAIESEIAAAEQRRTAAESAAAIAEANAAALHDQAIATATGEIAAARRQFELEVESTMLQIERERVTAAKELQFNQAGVIDKLRPAIEAPLVAEIADLQRELGRLTAVKKTPADHAWRVDQIRELITQQRGDQVGPNHLRVAGASESGKSYLINQFIAGGLASVGVAADFVVLDPFGSDTSWVTPPTVTDDPEAAAAIVVEWSEAAKDRSTRLERPTILVIDEGDTLIKDFALAGAVKDLLKMGRHANRFLWLCGQNGNTIPSMQWSDLRNMAQIYLGGVAVDYCENGLKGRDRNRLLGELEALSAATRYYALIQRKDAKPYCVTVPKVLFPDAAGSASLSDADPQATPAAAACPKCGGTHIKSDGYTRDRRRRIYCHGCSRRSTIG
jgi:hypothetical protein